ncbi:MAG: PmoA family protein [Kiritimatiellae bacterium]|nr:PmoA family protein [Kiritimatiellia bacterium]
MKLAMVVPLAAGLVCGAIGSDEQLVVQVDGKDLITYQAQPMSAPKGGDKFKASDFIHPLKTPAGFTVTGIQPDDHLHHLGLWWPWKHVEVDGRKVLCWELQKGDGVVQAQGAQKTPDGFTAQSIYVDRKAAGAPVTLLNETIQVKIGPGVSAPANGYNLDLTIVHESAAGKTLVISKYNYSGFALRGTAAWNKSNSTVVTSEGKGYDKANNTRARWVRVEGAADNGKTAGLVMMSHPSNQDHPELLRTWNPETHNGAVFVNFNTVQQKPWVFEPDKKYTRNFRVFVYDGEVSSEEAEKLWQAYSR